MGHGGQVGLVTLKCFLESNTPAEIVAECDFSAGLGRLSPQQQPVTVYMLSAYIQSDSTGLLSSGGGSRQPEWSLRGQAEEPDIFYSVCHLGGLQIVTRLAEMHFLADSMSALLSQ